MQPEVFGALIAAAAALVVALVNTRSADSNKVLLLEVKAELLAFKSTFVETLNGRYLRREEHRLIKDEADAIHDHIDAELKIHREHYHDKTVPYLNNLDVRITRLEAVEGKK